MTKKLSVTTRRLLSNAERLEVCTLYKNGSKTHELCSRFGVGKKSIRAALRNNGIKCSSDVLMRLSEEERAAIVCRYESGESAERVGADYNVHHMTIVKLLRFEGCEIRSTGRQYIFKKDFFRSFENELAAYWAGFIAADGCVSDYGDLEVVLGAQDESHLLRFAEQLETNYPLRTRCHHDKNQSFIYRGLRMRAPELCRDLALIGIVPRKTKILRWPSLSAEASRHFLRGYVDGDGSWGVCKGALTRFKVVSTEPFLREAQNLLMANCQLRSTRFEVFPASDSVRCMQYHGSHQVARIAEYLYRDATIYLPRKFETVRPFLSAPPATEGR